MDNEQKHENEHDSMSDLEVTDEQAEHTRAGDGEGRIAGDGEDTIQWVKLRNTPAT